MKKQSPLDAGGAVVAAKKTTRKGISRRSFVQSVGTTGAGTLLFSGDGRSANAQYGPATVGDLSAEQLTAMFTTMLKIRLWETKIKELILAGGWRGYPVPHLYVGQEAIAVGVCSALQKDDYIGSNHRGHGHLIAKGGDLGLMLAEITHKATGYCKGYGGSMHITDVSLGILGMNGIVGVAHLLAAGAAYGIKVKGTKQVAVSFGGDGSLQNSFFSSAANAAAAWKLPWLCIIENNAFQIWVRSTDVYGLVDLARRADGFGIEGRVVDGNDVLGVYTLAKYAVEKARAGGGPTVIECKTYRWYDHCGVAGAKKGADGAFGLSYRSDRELRDWMAKDPIARFRKFLVAEGILSDQRAEEIVGEVSKAVEDAVEFAKAQPLPKPEDGLRNVFADGAVPLHSS